MKVLLSLLSFLVVCIAIGCGGSGSGSGNPSPSQSATPTPTPIGQRGVKVFSVSPTSVSLKLQEWVTIRGEGFSGRTTITTHPRLNSLTVVSDTEIRGQMPPGKQVNDSILNVVYVIADGISSFDINAKVYFTTNN